jgi:hypothetical protein
VFKMKMNFRTSGAIYLYVHYLIGSNIVLSKHGTLSGTGHRKAINSPFIESTIFSILFTLLRIEGF